MAIKLKCNHTYSGDCSMKLSGVIAYIPFITERIVEVDISCEEYRDTERLPSWKNLLFMKFKAKSRKQLQKKLRKKRSLFEKMLEKSLGELDIGGEDIKKEMYENALTNYKKLIDNEGLHRY